MLELRIFFIAIFLFIYGSSYLHGQISSFGLGGYLGGGTISGNFPNQTSFSGSLFLTAETDYLPGLFFRAGYFYSRKIELLIPEDRGNRYYPYLMGLILKGSLQQRLGGLIFVEESLGPVIINDRTFSDRNEWNVGLSFALLIGIDFRREERSGIKTGLGTEFAGTFSDNSVSYFSVHLQLEYYFH